MAQGGKVEFCMADGECVWIIEFELSVRKIYMMLLAYKVRSAGLV